MIADSRFRKDLFYRLNVIALQITPLRERRSDIVPIARHLLNRLVADAAMMDIKLTTEAETVLRRYAWPGNVRELSNVLERTLSMLEGDVIDYGDLPFYLRNDPLPKSRHSQKSMKQIQAHAEAKAIREALLETGNNKAHAARMLGIHRTLLYKKMKKHGIVPEQEP
jgi:transcriptional regulator with PAS, ATPase and Fis domain